MTFNAIVSPTSYMDAEEANNLKEDIFTQLDQFEE